MRTVPFFVRLVPVLLLLSLLSACAVNKRPPELVYRLQARPSATAVSTMDSQPQAAHMRVSPLRSNRPQGESLGIIVAQAGPVVRVESFADGRWEEPPETVIERNLIAVLGDSAGDASSLAAEHAAVSTLRLQWSLDQFELVESPRTASSSVMVAIDFQLLASQRPDAVAAATIREQEPVAGGAPVEAVVLAFNRATSRALSQLIQQLRAAVAAMPPSHAAKDP